MSRERMLGECIHAKEVEVLPHLLEQIVQVPVEMGRNWDDVGSAREDIQRLDRDLVDLVEDVETGDVDAVPFDHIDQVVSSGVTVEGEVSVAHLEGDGGGEEGKWRGAGEGE
jgi:hypothetical protein